MEKLILVIVEAAVELVPEEIRGHPSVRAEARRRGKRVDEILLDRSYHHAAMKDLPENWKRGRPDITHFTLLEALGSPLNRLGLLETYVQLRDGHVIWINPETRLPRVYERFKGLIEKLYMEPVVKVDEKILLKMERKALKNLIDELRPDLKILLSEDGEEVGWKELGELIISHQKPMIMVGGFPRGDFSPETKKHADKIVRIWPTPLEAWTVTSRILCIIEQNLNIQQGNSDRRRP
ncbi:MAG: 16S rRNA methyltransferase [Thaumarchaeota archaeon]|nr:16S rRNA methyltransferase [Nitrososphaerota archaeon]